MRQSSVRLHLVLWVCEAAEIARSLPQASEAVDCALRMVGVWHGTMNRHTTGGILAEHLDYRIVLDDVVLLCMVVLRVIDS
jgi:hypothetical protein